MEPEQLPTFMYGVILLITAYPKSKKDDISAAGRKAMRQMIAQQHELLSRGPLR